MSEASLWWGLLVGSIGLGDVVSGRNQRRGAPLACGIGLLVFPSVVSNAWVMAIVGGMLLVVPWVVRL